MRVCCLSNDPDYRPAAAPYLRILFNGEKPGESLGIVRADSVEGWIDVYDDDNKQDYLATKRIHGKVEFFSTSAAITVEQIMDWK